MNADEWHFTVRPGSEAARGAGDGRRDPLRAERGPGRCRRAQGAAGGVDPREGGRRPAGCRPTGSAVAREFASAHPRLAVAGGVGSQHRGRRGALRRGQHPQLRRRQRRPDGALRGRPPVRRRLRRPGAAGRRDGRRPDRRRSSCTRPTRSTPCPKSPSSPASSPRCRSRSRPRCSCDETATACDLLLPIHHALESWDDLRPRAGVGRLMQPVMQPVFDSQATATSCSRRRAEGGRERWPRSPPRAGRRTSSRPGPPSPSSRGALMRRSSGGRRWRGAACSPTSAPVPRSGWPPAPQQVGWHGPGLRRRRGATLRALPPTRPRCSTTAGAPTAPGCWRCPDPVTKITWHSWVEIHPETAPEMDVRDGEVLRLTSPHGSIEVPAYCTPGSVPTSWRCRSAWATPTFGEYATGASASTRSTCWAARPATASSPTWRPGSRSRRRAQFHQLAQTEGTPRQLGRGIVRCDDAGPGPEGADTVPAPAAEQGARRRGESTPSARSQALDGWREAQHEKTLHGRVCRGPSPVGHGDRPRPLHRLLGLRRPPATPRTTSRRGRDRRSCGAAR